MWTKLFIFTFVIYQTQNQVYAKRGDDEFSEQWQKRLRRTNVQSQKEDGNIIDLNEPPAEMNYDTNFEPNTNIDVGGSSSRQIQTLDINQPLLSTEYNQNAPVYIDEGASSSRQNIHPYSLYDRHYRPNEEETAQYLLDLALQDDDEKHNEDRGDNGKGSGSVPYGSRQDVNLRDHSFVFCKKRTRCSLCRKYGRPRKQMKTFCMGCGLHMCDLCFKDKHELENVPKIKTTPIPVSEQECGYCKKNLGLGSEEDVIALHARSCRRIPRENEWQYACYVRGCNYKSYRIDCFKGHIRHHTKYQPYHCEIGDCDQAFRYRSSYRSHKRREHGITT